MWTLNLEAMKKINRFLTFIINNILLFEVLRVWIIFCLLIIVNMITRLFIVQCTLYINNVQINKLASCAKELSFCYKPKFSNPYIFATWWSIFDLTEFIVWNIYGLTYWVQIYSDYHRIKGEKDIKFLPQIHIFYSWYLCSLLV